MTFPQTDFPHWAQTALAESSWEGFIDVDGAWIHYITWGDVTKPPLVLIHGNAACGEWWRFIAPFLAEDYYVIAPDLAGMGDSSHTGRYERERYAQQVVTVAQTLAPGRKPLLVGHSLGGMVAILAGNAYGEQLAGIVVVDWPPQEPELKDPSPFDLAIPQPRIYPDRDSALARFKVVPKQDVNCAFYLQHIAQHSIKAEDGGWRWKFDPAALSQRRKPSFVSDLLAMRCPAALMWGALTARFDDSVRRLCREKFTGILPMTEIPNSRHHVMLDEPLALVTALRTQLANWR